MTACRWRWQNLPHLCRNLYHRRGTVRYVPFYWLTLERGASLSDIEPTGTVRYVPFGINDDVRSRVEAVVIERQRRGAGIARKRECDHGAAYRPARIGVLGLFMFLFFFLFVVFMVLRPDDQPDCCLIER